MSSNYKIRKIKSDNYDQWDNFVEKSNEGMLFHKSFWLEASENEFNIIGCFTGEELRAGMAIGIDTNMIGKNIVTNPVLSPYSGIIYEEKRGKRVTYNSNKKKMTEEIINYVEERYNNFSLNLSFKITDVQPFIWNNFNCEVKFTYVLTISDLDKVWKKMDSGTRRSIKKAQKDKLSVKKHDNFDTMLNLVKMSYNRQNMTIENFKSAAKRYFNILNTRDCCKNFVCYDKDDRPIGGVFIVWDNKRSYYLLGGYDPEHGHHGATSLAMWEAIKYTSQTLDLDQFDFEGSMVKSIERFFRKFGGELTPYYKIYKQDSILSGYKLIKEKVKTFIKK